MTGPAPAPAPNLGQTWVHRSTGERFVLYAVRTRTWVLVVADQPVTADTIREIPRAALAEYAYHGCDHTDHCCPDHGVHVSPHRGCVLR